jgi:formylglycine-generating enzyme required for sulfatase activity
MPARCPIEFVVIPAGQAILGTSDEQVRRLLLKEDWAREWHEKDMFQTEQPQHTVTLRAFEISRCPVTNADYHAFVWSTGYRAPRSWNGFTFPENLADHPVVDVSRPDAEAYCQWLSQQYGGVYRLSTEAEWERAARGDDDRQYPWGKEFDPWRCNTVESGKRGTTPVGSYSPSGDSPFGVSDMAGSVWEWTSSLFRPYPYDPNDGRENPKASGVCVVRGGAYYYSRKLARVVSREGVLPSYTSPTQGIRLARNQD